MEELRRLSGADFDLAYLKYQIQMHQRAIDLVQHTTDSVHDRLLQQHLKGARQDLITHLSTASAIDDMLPRVIDVS
jgi:predicted outer membrane protein